MDDVARLVNGDECTDDWHGERVPGKNVLC